MTFSIVILSKTDANLNRCIDSIRARGETCRVIVVDDGLTERRTDCEYLTGAKPFVFSRNANLGIRAASSDVFLMNDDAVLLTAGGLTRLHARAPESLVSAAVRQNVGNLEQSPRVPPQLREVHGNLAFICVLIPWAVYNLLGPLDERFDAYGWEDTDYCHRAREAGVRIMVDDFCHVDHPDGSTFRTMPDIREKFEAGKAQFEAKWGAVLP